VFTQVPERAELGAGGTAVAGLVVAACAGVNDSIAAATAAPLTSAVVAARQVRLT
jgi:hypothetical protein